LWESFVLAHCRGILIPETATVGEKYGTSHSENILNKLKRGNTAKSGTKIKLRDVYYVIISKYDGLN
jgi:hypothetical protein